MKTIANLSPFTYPGAVHVGPCTGCPSTAAGRTELEAHVAAQDADVFLFADDAAGQHMHAFAKAAGKRAGFVDETGKVKGVRLGGGAEGGS